MSISICPSVDTSGTRMIMPICPSWERCPPSARMSISSSMRMHHSLSSHLRETLTRAVMVKDGQSARPRGHQLSALEEEAIGRECAQRADWARAPDHAAVDSPRWKRTRSGENPHKEGHQLSALGEEAVGRESSERADWARAPDHAAVASPRWERPTWPKPRPSTLRTGRGGTQTVGCGDLEWGV